MEGAADTSASSRIPVTVLTGFLGSGKTTLLNWILTADHGKRIAVIENEFGEVGVDDSLVKKRFGEKENIIEMNNGCICCTVRGDLIEILQRLEDRLSDFDMVIIETTGLADPAPVCQTFFVDEKVQKIARLDAVVTVVDAKHILQHLDEIKPEGVENEAVEQLAFADRILLNKTDLASEQELVEIEKRIRQINGAAPLLRANLAEAPIPMDFILGVNAFDLNKVLSMDPNFLQDQDHMHDTSVSSVGFTLDAELSFHRLNRMISQLLRDKGNDLLRFKGVLAVRGSDNKFIFQGVHMLFDGAFSDDHLWEPNEKRVNKFIFIGKNLDRADLTQRFDSCVFKENETLRFPIGTKVLANCEDGWLNGKVAAHWERGNAYRIKLKGSAASVYAPEDLDIFVKADQKDDKKKKNKAKK